MNNRTIIIGDVHGMAEELQSLLDKLAHNEGDALVFAGDLVDKGPESVETIRMVRKLSARFNVVVVEGNHDERHRRFRKHLTNKNGVADMMKGAEGMAKFTKALGEKDKAFMDNFVLFHGINDHMIRKKKILVVHAGIPGNMNEFPATVEETRSYSNKEMQKLLRILRTRNISAETGEYVRRDDMTEADPFWADVYDGRFGHVVFGHVRFMNEHDVRHFPHATGIDTGAVFGGKLTAMVLEGESCTFVSVPSRDSRKLPSE